MTNLCIHQRTNQYPWFNALGARPALRFALQPDKMPSTWALERQGSVSLSSQDMEVLFGTPNEKDSQTGGMVWSVSFQDRTRGEYLAVLITNADQHEVDGYTARAWVISGIDNRALQAVREYVRFHFGSDAL